MIGSGYDAMQRETLSGRQLEKEVFSRITARLAAANSEGPGAPAALASALGENKKLWFTLAVDLATPGNHCPDELRGGLLSLAAFVENHTRAVIDGRATPDALIEINRNIIAGLSGPAAAAA